MTELDPQIASNELARSYSFSEAVVTDIGRRRKENQDAYAIVHTELSSLFVVADGMGGARGGGTASAIAVQVIAHHAIKPNGVIDFASIKESIELANKTIFRRSSGDEELTGMGTTIVALAFSGKNVFIAHVGDSRLYQQSSGKIKQLTRDHTLVQELVDTGAIAEQEAANHPIAHMLTRSLGPTDAVDVEVRVLPDVQPDDLFLLCSDGLYNLVSSEEIEAELQKNAPEPAANALVNLALERGGTDNVTVQIVRVLPFDSVTADVPGKGEVRVKLSPGAESIELSQIVSSPPVEPQPVPPPENAAVDEEKPAEDDSTAEDQLDDYMITSPPRDTDDNRDLNDRPDAEEGIFNELEFAAQGHSAEDESRNFAALAEEYSETEKTVWASQWIGGAVILVALAAIVSAFVLLQHRLKAPGTPAIQLASVTEPQEQQKIPIDEPQEAVPADEKKEAAPVPAQEQEPQLFPDSQPTPPDNTPPPPEVKEEQTEASPPPAPPAPEGTVALDEIRKQMEELTIPPPPSVVLPRKNPEIPDRPIVWENEQLKLAKLNAIARAKTETVPDPLAGVEPQRLLSQDEISKALERKMEIRSKIADLDLKVQLLACPDKRAADKKLQEVERELARISSAYNQAKQEQDKAVEKLRRWLELKKDASGRDKLKHADRIAELNDQVKQKKQNYSKTSLAYLESVDHWQQQPSDLSAASEMGARGREMQKARAELEEEETLAIAGGIEESIRKVSETSLIAEGIEQLQAQLNRHIGFVKAHIPLNATMKFDMRENYLKERTQYVEELKMLQQNIPDDREPEMRKLEIAGRYSNLVEQQ